MVHTLLVLASVFTLNCSHDLRCRQQQVISLYQACHADTSTAYQAEAVSTTIFISTYNS